MVDFDYIFENMNINDNLERDKDSLSRKTVEHKEKMACILNKVKEHPKKLNYKNNNIKDKILNKPVDKLNKKKDFVKRFLK